MPWGLCGLSASHITALAGVAHLRWRWRFGCNEFPCLAVDLFCFTKQNACVSKNHPVRWRLVELVEPIQLRLAVWSAFLRRFSRVGIFLPWQKPSANPGVEKFVANFSSGLRVNIFQNRRKSTRRDCCTGAGRCAKFDTSRIPLIRPLLEVRLSLSQKNGVFWLLHHWKRAAFKF